MFCRVGWQTASFPFFIAGEVWGLRSGAAQGCLGLQKASGREGLWMKTKKLSRKPTAGTRLGVLGAPSCPSIYPLYQASFCIWASGWVGGWGVQGTALGWQHRDNLKPSPLSQVPCCWGEAIPGRLPASICLSKVCLYLALNSPNLFRPQRRGRDTIMKNATCNIALRNLINYSIPGCQLKLSPILPAVIIWIKCSLSASYLCFCAQW